MTEKVSQKAKRKEICFLDDRIILGTEEILFSNISFFDVEDNDLTIHLFILGLNAISVGTWLLFGINGYGMLVVFFFISIVLSFILDDKYGKKYLCFHLKNGPKETIGSSSFKKIVIQLQVVWKNHDIKKLKQLNEWANKEAEALDKSLSESKKKIRERNFTYESKLTKWDNLYVLKTLELQSIFNLN